MFNCLQFKLFKFMIKPEHKKVSKDFLNYLKETPILPKAKLFTKQQRPKEIFKFQPVQGDFSKISCSYIVQNHMLIPKESIFYNMHSKQPHNQICQQVLNPNQIQLVKQQAKLEYLQKKGYLKPEQIERLQQIRMQIKKGGDQIQPKKTGNKKIFVQENYQNNDENFNPNVYETFKPTHSKLHNNHGFMPQNMMYTNSNHQFMQEDYHQCNIPPQHHYSGQRFDSRDQYDDSQHSNYY